MRYAYEKEVCLRNEVCLHAHRKFWWLSGYNHGLSVVMLVAVGSIPITDTFRFLLLFNHTHRHTHTHTHIHIYIYGFIALDIRLR